MPIVEKATATRVAITQFRKLPISPRCFQPSNLSAKPAIYVTVGGGKKSDILRH